MYGYEALEDETIGSRVLERQDYKVKQKELMNEMSEFVRRKEQ